jgi:hypothetical protein
MFEWIEKCISKVIEIDDATMGKCKEEDFTVDVAKTNYQKYLADLDKKREEYKLKLCDEIKEYSRMRFKHVSTSSAYGKDFMTREYLDDLKKYFESKGFTTKLVKYDDGDCYLKIIWESEEQ